MSAPPLRPRLIGSGAAVPETRVTSAEIERRLGLSEGWIRERSGIEERRVLRHPEALLDLAETAARAALETAGTTPRDLGAVIVATAAADVALPSVACPLPARR